MRKLFHFILAVLLISLSSAAFAANGVPLFGQKQPGNMWVFTDQGQTTGNVFFVDDSGTDSTGFGRAPNKPFATIDYAIGQCTAGQGDRIYVMPGHAESVATSITMDVAGVSIIGLGHGHSAPTLTTTATTDCITVTAADCRVENIIFAAPGIDAVTADINIAAARCTVKDTVHHGSTTGLNKVDIITIAAAGNDALIDGARIYNTTVEVVGGIVLEGAASRVEICNVMVQDAIGFTDGCLSDEATALMLFVHNCTLSNGKANTVVAEFGNNTTGVMRDCFINGRHTTIASNITTGTGMAFYETYVVEEAAKNALLMPAVDAE